MKSHSASPHTGRRTKRARLLGVTVGLIGITAMAACSSSDGSGSSGDTSNSAASSSSGAGSSSNQFAALQQEIDQYTKMPTAVEPGPAFDASKAKGKTIWTVPTSSSVPILKLQNDALVAALKPLGVKVVNYSADGSPDSWVTAMNQAIANKADAIVIEGIDPNLIAPQIAQARAAKIPVIWDFAIEGPLSEVAPTVSATVPLPFTLSAKLMADLAVVQTNGKANVVQYGLKTQRQNPVYTDGISKALAAACSSCKIDSYQDEPIPNWSQQLTSETRNLLTSKPDVNVLMPYFDGMVQFIEPAVTQANAQGQVRIITHDGTPSVLNSIKNGEVVTADVGTSNTWQAWATADQALRLLSGVPPVADEKIPVRIWTKDNIAEATGDNAEGGYGDSYMAMYKKLWGVTS